LNANSTVLQIAVYRRDRHHHHDLNHHGAVGQFYKTATPVIWTATATGTSP
jgi:hypothetical protein